MPRRGTTRTYRCDDNHNHGTIVCYKHGCGCDGCLAANTNASREWRRRKAYGRLRESRDVKAARTHLLRLRREGWTNQMLSDATGLHKAHLQRIMNHPPETILAATEQRIIAVASKPEPRPEAFVENIATARQLQGLFRHGWTLTELGDRLGKSPQQVWLMMRRQQYVTEATRRAVDALTAELGTVQPTGPFVTRTINRALRDGFVSLFAWDDITDKRERPKGAVKEAA